MKSNIKYDPDELQYIKEEKIFNFSIGAISAIVFSFFIFSFLWAAL